MPSKKNSDYEITHGVKKLANSSKKSALSFASVHTPSPANRGNLTSHAAVENSFD